MLWLIKSGRTHKQLISRALSLLEEGGSPADAMLASELEQEALALGLREVSAALSCLGQYLLMREARAAESDRSSKRELTPTITSSFSTLLLKVYLTGTDAHCAREREDAQRALAKHMQSLLATPSNFVPMEN
jgi:hypothetical protein